MLQGTVLHFISHTAGCVQNIYSLLRLSPHPDPSPSQLRWGLSPPESRSWAQSRLGSQWSKAEVFPV